MSLEKSIDNFGKTVNETIDGITAHAVAKIKEIGLIVESQATRIAELEQQLTDAKQAARWESDLASQALADLEPYRKDADRYQWIRSRVPGGTYRIMGIVYSEGGEGVDGGIDAEMNKEATQ